MKNLTLLVLNLAICLSSIEAGFLNFNHFRRLNWIEFKDNAQFYPGDYTHLNICWNRRAPPDFVFIDTHDLWLFGAGNPIKIKIAKEQFSSSEDKRAGFWGQRRTCHGFIFRFPDIDQEHVNSKLYLRLQNTISGKYLTKSPKFVLTGQKKTQIKINEFANHYGFNIKTGTRASNSGPLSHETSLAIQDLLKTLHENSVKNMSSSIFVECHEKKGYVELDPLENGNIRVSKDKSLSFLFPDDGHDNVESISRFPFEIENLFEVSKRLRALGILQQEGSLCFASENPGGVKVPLMQYQQIQRQYKRGAPPVYLKPHLTVNELASFGMDLLTDIINLHVAGVKVYESFNTKSSLGAICQGLCEYFDFLHWNVDTAWVMEKDRARLRLAVKLDHKLKSKDMRPKHEITEGELARIYRNVCNKIRGDSEKVVQDCERSYYMAKEKFLKRGSHFRIIE